jgi:hypothetical protein
MISAMARNTYWFRNSSGSSLAEVSFNHRKAGVLDAKLAAGYALAKPSRVHRILAKSP